MIFVVFFYSRALDVLLIMTAFLAITLIVTQFLFNPSESQARVDTEGANAVALKKEFDGFRRKYILVYLVIMLADWMQGTHMYTLYYPIT